MSSPKIGPKRPATKTHSLLEAYLPRDLAGLTEGYIMPRAMRMEYLGAGFAFGEIGHYELSDMAGNDYPDKVMYGAISGCNIEIIRLMLSRRSTDLNRALRHACGAEASATQELTGGDLQLLWENVRARDHIAIVELIAASGATWCDFCNSLAESHLTHLAELRTRSSKK